MDTISEYIKFCEEVCVHTKEVIIYPNNKPWVTRELKDKLRQKRSVYKTGNIMRYKELQNELEEEIERCKLQYKEKVENMFTSNNSRMAWKGLQKLTGYQVGKNLWKYKTKRVLLII